MTLRLVPDLNSSAAASSVDIGSSPSTGLTKASSVLTAIEVAELLTMSVQEVRRLTREGSLPARRIGKAYRSFRDGIVAWLDEQFVS